MNTYRVYSIFHPGAVEIIEAISSFMARRVFSNKHRIDLLDCVARRAFEFDRPATSTTHAQGTPDLVDGGRGNYSTYPTLQRDRFGNNR